MGRGSNRIVGQPFTFTRPWLAAALMLPFALAGVARADMAALAERLPPETDAVVAVNVEKLMATPYAKQEQWAALSADAWAQRPLMVPPGVSRLLMGAGMAAGEIESAWEVCLMETSAMPTLESLVEAEGGYIDRLWDKNGVASPINAYFVPLDANVLASITPADRRAAVRWIRESSKAKSKLRSEFIGKVVAGLSDDAADVVIAMDLEGAVAVPVIRQRLEDAELPELKSKDLDTVARILGSTLGVTLEVRAGEKLEGKAVVQFGEDASALKSSAKPLVAAILRRHGMRLDDVEGWTYKVSGKELTFSGALSTQGMRTLMGLVQSPIPAASTAAVAKGNPSTPANATAAAAPTTDPAQASLRYYKAVSSLLDGFSPKTSASETAVWFRRAGKRIDQMPILGVDPELVAWGSAVSVKLKEVAGVATVTQTEVNARVAGVKSTNYGSYSYDSGGQYRSNNNASLNAAQRAQREAAAQQSRAAALAQKAAAQERSMKMLGELAGSREQVRALMVQKYKIEF